MNTIAFVALAFAFTSATAVDVSVKVLGIHENRGLCHNDMDVINSRVQGALNNILEAHELDAIGEFDTDTNDDGRMLRNSRANSLCNCRINRSLCFMFCSPSQRFNRRARDVENKEDRELTSSSIFADDEKSSKDDSKDSKDSKDNSKDSKDDSIDSKDDSKDSKNDSKDDSEDPKEFLAEEDDEFLDGTSEKQTNGEEDLEMDLDLPALTKTLANAPSDLSLSEQIENDIIEVIPAVYLALAYNDDIGLGCQLTLRKMIRHRELEVYASVDA
ncbi:predicted protein [Phaeodactylum tricornutum CCAP 1055/1]|jgi:hypothetical protein|uniref:Uncharacterized protein n=1 Tax=Phaeodactylum tricornutum (strain CCAP 1055/1) TaxID=556484 RepID=B7G8Z4_PHATC|nr:predicted protein [Phaeodactylum tricornutum CCAP 1055/1]EEC44860.1 predicted protein [Phaeodactylum tricornutum CCAP 1055/1]|eukprot:XP_002183678.1 predicted protein [Phaeodactylum tricornutum CCAP 1055/1]